MVGVLLLMATGATAQVINWTITNSGEIPSDTVSNTPEKPEVIASQTYKGTMERFGHKMEYSFSGGIIYEKTDYKPQTMYTSMSPSSILCLGEISEGAKINASCKRLAGSEKYKEVVVHIICYGPGTRVLDEVKKDSKNSVSASLTVPSGTQEVNLLMEYKGKRGNMFCSVQFTVVEKQRHTALGRNSWEEVAPDNQCHKCKKPYSQYVVQSMAGASKKRCWQGSESDYQEVKFDHVIYYDDYIVTDNGEGCDLLLGWGDEWGSVRIMENTKVKLVQISPTKDRWQVYRGRIVGRDLKHVDQKAEFQLSNCTAVPQGTIFVLEDDGTTSRVYLFSGSMDITSTKNGKKVKLKPGEASTVSKNGEQKVQKFDMLRGAKKFGITAEELQNEGVDLAATVVKRYELERAIVKYKVTSGSQQGVLAKCFDNYGQQERRELKIGNSESIVITQGNISYTLDKKTKIAKRSQNADLNFLEMNEGLMKRLNLQKKGTATVINKKCTVYTGTNVEYYVWKGLVLKKVTRDKNGKTIIHEVVSIEEPTSIDGKLFEVPSGYRKK